MVPGVWGGGLHDPGARCMDDRGAGQERRGRAAIEKVARSWRAGHSIGLHEVADEVAVMLGILLKRITESERKSDWGGARK